jgi:hypothetical protein
LVSNVTFINFDLTAIFSADLSHSVNNTITLSDAKLYYKCDAGATFKDDTLAFMVKQFRVQAFNVESGKFSDTGEYVNIVQ